MRFIIIAASLFLSCQAFGQNFILPDGEYMDTISPAQTNCRDYNYYYYSVGGKYPKNSSTILKEARLFVQNNNETYTGDGYISFRFKIDCEGKLMQKVQVMQTDENYSSTHFNKNLVNELFAFLKTLDNWNIAKTKDGELFLYRAFLTFKIKDGKIINIIP